MLRVDINDIDTSEDSLAKKAIGLDKEILVLLAKRKPEYTKSNCKGIG